jgi:23S rRNA pseudouridine1911/1915/1917 synthase
VAAGWEDATRAGIVHRLDRDTSGLLVVARSEAVHRALRTRCRRAPSRASTWRWSRAARPRAAGRSTRRWGATGAVRTRMSTDDRRSAHAVTHFELERALPRTTLLRVRLETGAPTRSAPI